MKQIELSTGGIYNMEDTAVPIAVSRTGSTEMYAVEGRYLEVSYLKSGRLIGNLGDTPPNWVKPVNYQWAKH